MASARRARRRARREAGRQAAAEAAERAKAEAQKKRAGTKLAPCGRCGARCRTEKPLYGWMCAKCANELDKYYAIRIMQTGGDIVSAGRGRRFVVGSTRRTRYGWLGTGHRYRYR